MRVSGKFINADFSVPPGFRAQRGAVQERPLFAPPGQVLVHEAGETVRVVALQEMHQLMNDDVFQAFLGLFGQFGIEADGAGPGVATLTSVGFPPIRLPPC